MTASESLKWLFDMDADVVAKGVDSWGGTYGTFVLFSALSVREIGTAHFGFEGRNKEHQDPRFPIGTLTGPWVK